MATPANRPSLLATARPSGSVRRPRRRCAYRAATAAIWCAKCSLRPASPPASHRPDMTMPKNSAVSVIFSPPPPRTLVHVRPMLMSPWSSDPPVRPLSPACGQTGSIPYRRVMAAIRSLVSESRYRSSTPRCTPRCAPLSDSKQRNRSVAISMCRLESRPFCAYSGCASEWEIPLAQPGRELVHVAAKAQRFNLLVFERAEPPDEHVQHAPVLGESRRDLFADDESLEPALVQLERAVDCVVVGDRDQVHAAVPRLLVGELGLGVALGRVDEPRRRDDRLVRRARVDVGVHARHGRGRVGGRPCHRSGLVISHRRP